MKQNKGEGKSVLFIGLLTVGPIDSNRQTCHLIQREGEPVLVSTCIEVFHIWMCENIQSGNYQETSAPLEIWAGGIQQIAQHAQDSHIHAEFPQLIARLFQQEMNDGYGREEVSPLFKVLQKSS